jgi:hypothetical protein
MAGRGQERPKINAYGTSVQNSFRDFNDDDAMMENEADNMSLDGSASASCSEAPDDDITMNDDPEDMTDDEDWATMGAAALRAESYPNMAAALENAQSFNGLRSFSAGSGMARAPQTTNLNFSPTACASDAQEREAIEALLRLGSV